MSKSAEPKDNFAIYQKGTDKFFEQVEHEVSDYYHAFTDLQEEFVHAWKNFTKATLSIQKEYASKAGFNTTMPKVTEQFIEKITDEFLKTRSVRDQILLATIEGAQKNIKIFNDNTNAFSNLNRDIMQSWISIAIPVRS